MRVDNTSQMDWWSPTVVTYTVTSDFAKSVARAWLESSFGERCPETSDNCECCRRWRLFDELFAEAVK